MHRRTMSSLDTLQTEAPPQTVATRVFRAVGDLLILITAALVLCGAAYFGFFSCGGYVWHKDLFWVVTGTATVAAVVAPSMVLRSLGRKIFFVAFLFIAYFTIEATVATFYPGPPESLSEFVQLFVQSLELGPCR
jgi:hypothetical protein